MIRSGSVYDKAYERKNPGSNWKKLFINSALFASVIGFVVAEDEQGVGPLDDKSLEKIVKQVIGQLSAMSVEPNNPLAQAGAATATQQPIPEATQKAVLETFAPLFRGRPPNFWSKNTANVAFNRTIWYVQNMLEDKLPLTLVFLSIMSLALLLATLLPILFRRFLPLANVPEPIVRLIVHLTLLFFIFGGLALAINAVGGSPEDLWIAYGFATILIMPNLSGVFSNAISAFSLTFETKVRVGSEIYCEGHQGIVLEFNLRNVVLLRTTSDPPPAASQGDEQPRDKLVLLPNEYLTKYPVEVLGYATNIGKLKLIEAPQMDYSLNIKKL
jgi:hypothetical protein